MDLSAALAEVSQVSGDASKSVAHFSHRVIDDLCGRGVNFGKEFPTVKRSHDLAQVLQASIRSAFARDPKKTDLASVLTETYGVPAKAAKLVASAVASREAEIKKQLVEHLVKISTSHMTDFDWSLRLTMATSHLSQVSGVGGVRGLCVGP